jgi:hypothetical protein
MEELIEKYRMTKERIDRFGERLLAIDDGLAKKDQSESHYA